MTVWDQILNQVERRVSTHSFNTWFRPTRYSHRSNGSLVVRVPNRTFQTWLRERYAPMLEALLAECAPGMTGIEFITDEDSGKRLPSKTTGSGLMQTALDFEAVDHQLNPRYTFDSFVVGTCNQFAHAAALAVAEQPSRAYNPLFIYGGVGLGKTHLMQAVGHLIKLRLREVRLAYVSAEKFTNEVINSLRHDRMVSFREKYRTIDVLLVDDIEFIVGKERTQEEFFHTFNALYDAQKQIVLSSDCTPKEIPSLEERLRSRFEWGLIADLQPPDLETKMAILMRKAEQEKVTLPATIVEFIAKGIKSNIRELEGSLIRLLAYSSLTGSEIALPMAQHVLKNIIDSSEKKVTIELIQKRVGEQFGLRVADLKARNNSRAVAYPRQIATYLAKQLTSASLPEIGREFGGKHHTTILHSIRKIEELRKNDKDLNRLINNFLDSFA